jgi:hypothetical protein
MSDSPSHRGVIPLFAAASSADAPPSPRPQVTRFFRRQGAVALRFFFPALLLACGAAMMAFVVASIGHALGWTEAGAAPFAATVATWTFLGAGGFAVAAEGLALARARWR